MKRVYDHRVGLADALAVLGSPGVPEASDVGQDCVPFCSGFKTREALRHQTSSATRRPRLLFTARLSQCRSPSLLRHQGAKKNSTQSETPEEEVPTGTTSSTSLAHANQQPITASTDCWMTSLLPHKQRGQIYLAARGIPPPSSGEQPPLAVFTAVEAKPRVFCSVCVGSRRQCLWRCLRFRQQPGLLGESRLCGPPAG